MEKEFNDLLKFTNKEKVERFDNNKTNDKNKKIRKRDKLKEKIFRILKIKNKNSENGCKENKESILIDIPKMDNSTMDRANTKPNLKNERNHDFSFCRNTNNKSNFKINEKLENNEYKLFKCC